MDADTVTATTELGLASPSGIVTRKMLCTPLRDALPSEMPIIDMSPIFSSSLDERQAVAQQVRTAAQNMGFFYMENHGIPADVTQDVYEAMMILLGGDGMGDIPEEARRYLAF
ncbi:hypothetical protein V8C34DRAFT_308607 [Trichoderma compactum]